MAEGAPLLREYGGNLIEGSNPSLSEFLYFPNIRNLLHTFTFISEDENPRVRLKTQDVFLHGLLPTNARTNLPLY